MEKRQKNPAAVALAARRMVKMTPERRSEVASIAGRASGSAKTAAERRELARKAIAVRWAKWRAKKQAEATQEQKKKPR